MWERSLGSCTNGMGRVVRCVGMGVELILVGIGGVVVEDVTIGSDRKNFIKFSSMPWVSFPSVRTDLVSIEVVVFVWGIELRFLSRVCCAISFRVVSSCWR